ncbi:MAG: hypothetical protein P4L61_02615 [Candidatus Pacebacteria bacterium]|nr:hypothetical protein [Candidatus Paceibacterota bacterium]
MNVNTIEKMPQKSGKWTRGNIILWAVALVVVCGDVAMFAHFYYKCREHGMDPWSTFINNF